ncbi:hypothetical protein QQF64_000082 [Cirrhinus molitorella]|uniref:Uncharacterized protein n=1 Tax=Cirrhinus molitorella TaxID=172907 RepID=A0ABR3NW54_9TELE
MASFQAVKLTDTSDSVSFTLAAVGVVCRISGLLHLLFLSGFVWMFIEAAMLFICVKNLSQISSKKKEVLSSGFLQTRLGFFTNGSKVLEILFLILNSQQGTFIFLIYCVLNDETVTNILTVAFSASEILDSLSSANPTELASYGNRMLKNSKKLISTLVKPTDTSNNVRFTLAGVAVPERHTASAGENDEGALQLSTASLTIIITISHGLQVLCAVIAGLLHFLFLSGFVWMFIEAVLLFICVKNLSQISSKKRKVLSSGFLCVIGYLVALVVVCVSVGLVPGGYGSEQIVVFKTLAQFVVLGCSWIPSFFTNGSKELEILFQILNSQQGTFIFLIYCVLNNEVRQQYRKFFRCLCCVKH